MTPAIVTAEKANIKFRVHEYAHDPDADSYGKEAAAKLGIPPGRVFKTLIVDIQAQGLAVAVIPVSAQLDLKRFAIRLGAKRAAMADAQVAQRVTGYVLGGVSPLGQKRALPTVIDRCAEEFTSIFVSAGRRGLEIELSPTDLRALTRAQFAPIAK